MSYRCDECNRVSPKGKKQLNRVVQTRQKTYINPATGRVIGRGHEIVKEHKLCMRCFKKGGEPCGK